jgi:hypothetical protein
MTGRGKPPEGQGASVEELALSGKRTGLQFDLEFAGKHLHAGIELPQTLLR